MHTIHVATYKRGGKRDPHFRAIAVVVSDGWKGWAGQTGCTADTREEAVEGAAKAIRDSYWRDGLAAPESVVDHGNMSRIDVDGLVFAHRASPWR
jgi:hypothetical protein